MSANLKLDIQCRAQDLFNQAFNEPQITYS